MWYNDTNLDNQVETTQAIQTRSNVESLLDRSTKSETSLISNDSHIYQEIEDLYIDDSIPSNLDSKCKNSNFPEPFYFALDPESAECSCDSACSCKKHLYN